MPWFENTDAEEGTNSKAVRKTITVSVARSEPGMEEDEFAGEDAGAQGSHFLHNQNEEAVGEIGSENPYEDTLVRYQQNVEQLNHSITDLTTLF